MRLSLFPATALVAAVIACSNPSLLGGSAQRYSVGTPGAGDNQASQAEPATPAASSTKEDTSPPAKATQPDKNAPLDEVIAHETKGYDRFLVKNQKLEKPTAIEFAGRRGDCFVLVFRVLPGGEAKSAVMFDIREKTRRWGIGLYRLDGGVTSRYCLVEDGPVTIDMRSQNTISKDGTSMPDPVVGSGLGRAEVWKDTASAGEVAQGEKERAAQKGRDRQWDMIKRSQHETGCVDCREYRSRCQQGDKRRDWAALGWSCEEGFQDCLGNRDVEPKTCP